MQQAGRWGNILATVESGQRFMDMLCTSAAVDYCSGGGEIFCGKGCGSCCTLAVNCSAAEAFLVGKALDKRQQEKLTDYIEKLKEVAGKAVDMKDYLRLHRKELGGCPFLEEGICGIYSVRPISCRALLATKESRWCGVDFSELASTEKLAFVESLDRRAVAFPMHYLASTQETGQILEAELSLQMLQEHGFSLYGSMPVLVYLFAEHDLFDCFGKGADTVMTAATAAGLASSFLLQVETL
jgi:Fe-S-cluster containining protein